MVDTCKELVGLMCQRIPLVLTPFLWVGPAAGGTGLYERCKERAYDQADYPWGDTRATRTPWPITAHTTKGTASAFQALPCDQQVKPGEFHLQKIPSVALVVLSQYYV